MRPVQKEITTQTADEGIFDLEQCTREGLVFSVSGVGKTLSGGTLDLAQEAYIIFDNTCNGVDVEDVVIQGVIGSVQCISCILVQYVSAIQQDMLLFAPRALKLSGAFVYMYNDGS